MNIKEIEGIKAEFSNYPPFAKVTTVQSSTGRLYGDATENPETGKHSVRIYLAPHYNINLGEFTSMETAVNAIMNYDMPVEFINASPESFKLLEFNEVDAGWYMCDETDTLAIASKEQPYLEMENIDHVEVYQFDEDGESNQRLIGIFDTMPEAIAYSSAVYYSKLSEPYFTIGHPETIALAVPVSIHALIQLNQLPDALPLESWQIELLKSVEVGQTAFSGLNMEDVTRVG